MYTEFYNLIERPFELTPDPRYVYLSAHHKDALAHLKYGVEERKGFIQLTGEVGTGKTTMLDVLVSELDASTSIAKLSYTTIDELDLLRLLARGFGIEGDVSSKAMILDILRQRLSTWSAEGRNAVFVVDEAQNLSLPVLEEIRLLSNLRSNGRLSFQIILAGQPELREKLESNELRQLRQRIGIRYHLTPLSRQETGEYVAHRMAVAGSEESVFDAGAIEAIYEHSGGVPRVINMVCDRALLAGYAENRRRVTRKLIERAIHGLEGVGSELPPISKRPEGTKKPSATDRTQRRKGRARVRWAAPLAAAFAIVVIAIGAVFYFEGRERSSLSPGEQAQAAHGVTPDDLATGVVSGTPVSESDRDLGEETLSDSDGAQVAAAVPAGQTPVSAEEIAPPERSDEDVSLREDRPSEAWIAFEEADESRGVDADAADRPYVLVAASSQNREAALRQIQAMSDDGMGASVWTVDLGGRGVWHRVILDAGFDSLSTAHTAVKYLKEMGYTDTWVARR